MLSLEWRYYQQRAVVRHADLVALLKLKCLVGDGEEDRCSSAVQNVAPGPARPLVRCNDMSAIGGRIQLISATPSNLTR
jgi:hypothetical protein